MEDFMRIAVIDGQGGGIGRAVVEKIREELGNELEIIALGTNSLATGAMLKAGANQGATGENAIVFTTQRVEVIIGSIAIIAANSMLGELTPLMAKAIAESPAHKILIPLNKHLIHVVGVRHEPLPHYIDDVITVLKNTQAQMKG